MGYRLEERYCRTCRRATPHWCEQGVLASPTGWLSPFIRVSRAIYAALIWRWSCLNCVHPWRGTLLKPATRVPATGGLPNIISAGPTPPIGTNPVETDQSRAAPVAGEQVVVYGLG